MAGAAWRWCAREPLNVLAVVLGVLQVAATAINFSTPVGPQILPAVPALALGALSVVAMWLAWRASRDRAGRRFWRTLCVASAGTLAGEIVGIGALRHGPEPAQTPLTVLYSVVPLVMIIVALYRLPVGARGRGERQRTLLDVATVTFAAAVSVWYLFRLESDASRHPSVSVLAVSGVVIVVLAVMMFGIVKVLMAGSRAVDPVSLRMFSIGLVIEVAGNLVAPVVPTRPHYSVEFMFRTVFEVLSVLAPVRAWRTADGPPADARGAGRRPFSVLPYLAVAGVDALLLLTLWGHEPRVQVMGAAAVTLTGLVAVRQLGALRENARLLNRLRRQERRFRSLVQNAVDVIAIRDRDGTLTYASPGTQRLLGLDPDDLLGTQGPGVHPEDRPDAEAAFRAVLDDPHTSVTYEARLPHADGGWRRVRVTLSNRLDDPAVRGIITNSTDITESHAYHRQLSHQASHDALTDLANRSLFGEQLARALARGDGRPVSLALVDLDDFKVVNDTLGHPCGDALLIAVAERLRRSVRPHDLVARLGGDEFAVLLDGAGADNAERVADRMLGILTEPLVLDGHELCVQASVGIAQAGPGEDGDRLLRHADLALYEAKSAGKGRYARYATHMRPHLSLRAESAARLHRALTDGEFELHYQPIVELPQGRLAGVEALLRWRDPERGMVAPMEFLPAAEQTGMIVPIGRWVLGQACRDMAGWLAAYPGDAPGSINVNVSPRQLVERDFVADVAAALAAAGLPAERLVVEMTETTIAGDVGEQLRTLRAMGVRIALDDFGTGQSTLSLLDVCPVDELKLDRSFVREAGLDKVATVVAVMGQVLGVEVVAEGVETGDQAEHLHRLGYGLAQGFHFARPVPAAELIAMFRRGDRVASGV